MPEHRSRIAVEESIIVDFQVILHTCLIRNKISQRELAKRLEVSEAYISQLFNDRANPSLKVMARVLHAAGYEVILKTKRLPRV